MNKIYCLLVCLCLLPGCANRAPATTQASEPEKKEEMRSMHAELVREMIRQEQFHAALAHIEEIQRNDFRKDELLLLHARVLFNMGEVQAAHAEYSQLLGSAWDAEAMHGIGLIYALSDRKLSLRYLSKASMGKPTDAGMRNDYGFALLREAKLSEAEHQLATAHELAPQDGRYRNNAILAKLLLNKEQQAQDMARKGGLSPANLEQIRQQAERWKERLARKGDPEQKGVETPAQTTSVAAASSK